MGFIILPVALLVMLTATAQDTSLFYLNAKLEITAYEKEASYTARVWKEEDGWGCRALYSNNKGLAFTGAFTTRQLTVRNGWFSFYYPASGQLQCMGYFQYNVPVSDWQRWYGNGQPLDSGSLHHGKKVGPWKEWHSNGQLKTAGTYVLKYGRGREFLFDIGNAYSITNVYNAMQEIPDIKEGVWVSWHSNGRQKDSVLYTENQKEGMYKAWHKNGMPEVAGMYIHNKENGTWNWRDDKGRLRAMEVYETGVATTITCYDTAGQPAGEYCNIHKPAVFKTGMEAFPDYLNNSLLAQELQLPAASSGIIIVHFIINTQGKAEEIFIEGAPTTSCEAHIKQVLLAMPAWHPAVYHNMPGSDQVSVAIRYAGKNIAASRPRSGRFYESEEKIFHDPLIFPSHYKGYKWW